MNDPTNIPNSKLLHCEHARERIVFQVSGQVDEFGRLAKGVVSDSGSSELIIKSAKKLVSRESYIEKTESDIAGSCETLNKQPLQLETMYQHLVVLEESNKLINEIVSSIKEGLNLTNYSSIS
ncbi:hypothetical protein LOD99_6091 [Oopsacas minuta]|uniref:BLOC-1-related complex subunit 7 n=1 Tax=Oopsacas minuta TaxID=111878 RepID=A0AAV7JMZ6_9METZ|nr:hypothetical protein LOD99_6091 [Oopsacas minuta]